MPPAPQDLAPGVVKPSPPVSGGNTTQQALLRPDTASIVPACPRPTQGRSAESPGRPLGLGGSLAGVPNSRCAGQGEDRHMCPTPSLPQHDDITSEVTLHHRYQWVDRACTRAYPGFLCCRRMATSAGVRGRISPPVPVCQQYSAQQGSCTRPVHSSVSRHLPRLLAALACHVSPRSPAVLPRDSCPQEVPARNKGWCHTAACPPQSPAANW